VGLFLFLEYIIMGSRGIDLDEIDDLFDAPPRKRHRAYSIGDDDDTPVRPDKLPIGKKKKSEKVLTPAELRRKKYLESLNQNLKEKLKPVPLPGADSALPAKHAKIWSTLDIPDFEIDGKRFDEDIPQEEMHEEDELAGEDSTAANKNDVLIAKPANLRGNVSSKKVRGLVTLFGQRADAVLQMLEDDQNTNGALTLLQRSLLQTMVDILPVIERQVRRSKGKKGVYQLNQIVAQVREQIQDMQALREKGNAGATVVDRIIRPAYLDLAAQVQNAYMEIEAQARTRMSEEEFKSFRETALLSTKKGLAEYINGQYNAIREGVITSLS
jgi:hypothetical protein